MKRDARKHVLIDANVLVAYLDKKTHRSEKVHKRSQCLLDSVLSHGWPAIQLYVPSICVAETQCVLDRHRYCDWYGSSKDPAYRLTKKEYVTATKKLDDLLLNRDLIQIELHRDHVHAASLVSIVNAKYQYNRRRKKKVQGKKNVSKKQIKGPMGAADCIIMGMAIDLALRVGIDDVSVVTADTRLADVVSKCRKLGVETAKNLGLDDVASRIGESWSQELYPCAIHLEKLRTMIWQQHLAAGLCPSELFEKKHQQSSRKEKNEYYLIVVSRSKQILEWGLIHCLIPMSWKYSR
jgi:predicted nucleic acid-binding protein